VAYLFIQNIFILSIQPNIMKTTTIIITLLIISGIFTILAGIYPDQAEKVLNTFSKKDINLNQESSEDYPDSPIQKSTSTTGTSDSEQTSTAQTTTPTAKCTLNQISYGIKNLIKNSNCTEYSGETCISKEVSCSVEVYNYDYETSGNFELEFKLTDETENIIKTLYQTSFIQPKGNKTLEIIFRLEKNADKILICNYQTTKIPQKTIC